MKTTIELPDELLDQLRRVARQEDSTLRRLVEEGLQRCLKARRTAAHRSLYHAVPRAGRGSAAPNGSAPSPLDDQRPVEWPHRRAGGDVDAIRMLFGDG